MEREKKNIYHICGSTPVSSEGRESDFCLKLPYYYNSFLVDCIEAIMVKIAVVKLGCCLNGGI